MTVPLYSLSIEHVIYTVYQLSMLMSIYDNKILIHTLELMCPYFMLILAMYVLYMLGYLRKYREAV